ncbi:MAG: PAS domain-containing protein [Rhodospirillaceae bacterium]|nr:PAS domain-containing protein [Rhodospirillaceae bacterium]
MTARPALAPPLASTFHRVELGKPMNKKRNFLSKPTVMLPLLICLIGVATAGASTATLFSAAIDEDKSRLKQIVNVQARLMEAVAKFDVEHGEAAHPDGSFVATMGQIVDAHKSLGGFGETGEFVIGKLINGEIAILQKPRFDGDVNFQVPPFIPEPMQRALNGETGEIIAIDYKGNQVLASYASVGILNIGLVAKIDTDEVYQPFIISGTIIAVLTLLMIVVGVYASRKFSVPFAQLEKSQTRFNKSQEFANIGTWDWNVKTGELYWSDRIAPLFGYKKDELETTYDNFVGSIHPDDRQMVTDAVTACVETGAEYNIEHRTLWPDGTVHWLHESGDVVRDDAGSPLNMLGVVQDITERKSMQEQLIQSSKMATLGEMATGVAHELNQPLNVIRMAVGNLKNKLKNNKLDVDHLNDKLNKVDSMVERAASIIDHMRIFGRTAASDTEPLIPVNIINGAMGLMGEQLRLANIDVTTTADEEDNLILGNQIQIEQVLLNLLTNARDAMKDNNGNKNIMFKVNSDDDSECVSIEVEDSGGGIDPEHLPRIFEPFYTTKEVGQGTGLGLSISYGIIAEMGGRIEAENTATGAKFIITLPAQKRERAA